MNNNKLINYLSIKMHRFNIVNSLIIFFLSIVVIYQIHFWTDGIILSSPLLTVIILFSSLAIFSYKKWPWMKFTTDYARDPRDWIWIIVSSLASYLTIRFYFKISYLQGDFGIHKLWILQLLNGSVETHPAYKDLPGGIYPFLSHTIIAVFTNLSDYFVQHSFIFYLILLTFLVPFISYKLARQIGFPPLSSLLLSGFISLYSGLDYTVYDYMIYGFYFPATQMFLAKTGRNLSILLFLLFLISCSKFSKSSELTYSNSITTGILLGLIGLCYHSGFIAAVLFIIIIYGVNYKASCLQKKVFLNLVVILLTCAVLASFYFIPAILKIFNYGGVDKPPHAEYFPTSFFSLYGPLPFLGLYALLKIKDEKRNWVLSFSLTIISICLLRFLLGLVIPIDLLSSFFLRYFGGYLFICLAFLAIAGVNNLLRFKKIKHAVILIMILIISIGYKTSHERLREDVPEDLFPGITKSEISSAFLGNYFQETPNRISDIKRSEIIERLFSNSFPEKGIERIRFSIPNPTNTLIVPSDPPELAFTILTETGLNISYLSDQYFRAMVTFSKKTVPQEQRLKMVDAFYDDLTKGILRKDILLFFKTDIFLSPYNDLVEKLSQLERITSVQVEDKEYFLYKWTTPAIEPVFRE